MFAGLTRDIDGFLRKDFEAEKIKTFMSMPVFADGSPGAGVRSPSMTASRSASGRDDEKAAMEIVALALGDAIERSQSGRPCRRGHPRRHAAGLARCRAW